jgi:hypothetical protein
MADDPLGVTISAREIYDEIVGMRADVQSLAQSNASSSATLADHESRIRAVERWKYGVPAATLSGVIATAVALYSVIK